MKAIRCALDEFEPTFRPDEQPAAATALAGAIMGVIKTLPGPPGLVELLRRGCEVFPDSARLADLLGQALRSAGRYEEAYAQRSRALEIRRIATEYNAEFPQEDATIHFWEFAETISRATGRGSA